jgi:hypothetical protein
MKKLWKKLLAITTAVMMVIILLPAMANADVASGKGTVEIIKNGETDKCIDVAILAEGYTPAEMNVFYQDAEIACERMVKLKANIYQMQNFLFIKLHLLRTQKEKTGSIR